MRIVQANAVYDPQARTAHDLLDRYRTLTESSVAMAAAGAAVSVVQRFHTASTIERDGIVYEFVSDSQPPWLSTGGAPAAFVKAVAGRSADVVHVNGLIFPQLVAAIRSAVGASPAIVVQHHGGEFPVRGSGLVGMWQRRQWRNGLSGADAVSFTAAEQAAPWREAGVVGPQRVLEIIEAGTLMREVNRERARTAIGATGAPVILWVGRLTTNKDPLTILDGLERALPTIPSAQVVMVFGDDTLRDIVEQRVRASSILAARVVMAGRVPQEELANYYGAADVFISGSHSEGSGYALIESMSAGVIPVVTAIPSFRAIAGDCGARFSPGDHDGFAKALLDVCNGDRDAQTRAVRSRFDRVLSWSAIAKKTIDEYQSIVDGKRR
ncbi:MAG: glycosyltransferase family 4 protein [Acidobacteriota bacterium]